MKTPNASKVGVQGKHEDREVITPKSDSLHNDAGMSGIMTRSRLKRLSARDNKELCDNTETLGGSSEISSTLRKALLSCFEDSQGNTLLTSTSTPSKNSQMNSLLYAKGVTPLDKESVTCESRSLRKYETLKSDNSEQDLTNAHRSVSVALYNATEKENPFVTVTVSGLCNNLKADIMVHDTKGRNEVYAIDSKVNSSLLSPVSEQTPNHAKKGKKAIKSIKKSPSSLNENKWTVTAISEHTTECGNETGMGKVTQESDNGPLQRTELLDGPSVSPTNDELSPNTSQKEQKIKKSLKNKVSPPHRNGTTVSTSPEHPTKLENEIHTVKSPQKFTRSKLSPITADFDKSLKSISVRSKETRSRDSSDLESDAKSEVNAPLSGLESWGCSLVSPNNDEPSPNSTTKERKAKKSRKQNLLLLNREECRVATVSERITASEIEIGKMKYCQESDKYSLNSTGSLDDPSVASDRDESFPSMAHKKGDLKKSIKDKLLPPNKNEGNIPVIPECTAEVENETCEVKSPQKFGRSKNRENPSMTISSQLLAETEACPKSAACIRNRETQLKNLNDTLCTLADSGSEANKTRNNDEHVTENIMVISEEKKCRKEKKLKMCKEQKGNKIVDDTTIGILASDEEIGIMKSTGTSRDSVVGPDKEQGPSHIKPPVQEGVYSENHFCNISVQDFPDSKTRHVKRNCKAKISPVCESKMTREIATESSESDSDAESRKAIMESAQRRIIQNISTSESESKKFVRPITESSGSDTSDSVPDAMSFSTGRQLVMESVKNVSESIQKEEHRRKEKRKQRLEKYKQQKEEKLIRLKERRASQEDASCSSSEESGCEEVEVPSTFGKGNRKEGVKWEKENLDDLPQCKGKRFLSDDEEELQRSKDKKRKHEEKNTSQHFGNLRKLPDDVLENLPDRVQMKRQKTDGEATSIEKRSPEKHDKYGHDRDQRQATHFRKQSDIDYIPLSTSGATEFGVMPLDKFMRAPKSMAERAAEFRQDMLFGSRIRREPANARAIHQQKLKASGKDRFFR